MSLAVFALALVVLGPSPARREALALDGTIAKSTTLVLSPLTSAAALKTATTIGVKDDGFVVGATVVIHGAVNPGSGPSREEATVKEVAAGSITLHQPLQFDHPRGSAVVQRLAFGDGLRIGADLRLVNAASGAPPFISEGVNVAGDLAIARGGSLTVAAASSGNEPSGVFFYVTGRVSILGSVEGTVYVDAGKDVVVDAKAPRAWLDLDTRTGPTSIRGSFSFLGVFGVGDVTILDGTRVTSGLTIASLGGDVRIEAASFSGGSVQIYDARNVTTGDLKLKEIFQVTGLSGALATGKVQTGVLVSIDGGAGSSVTAKAIATKDYLSISNVDGDVRTGMLTASTSGRIQMWNIGGAIVTGDMGSGSAFLGDGGSILGNIGGVTTGTIKTDDPDHGLLITGIVGDITTGAVASAGYIRMEAARNVLTGRLEAGHEVALTDIREVLRVRYPVKAGRAAPRSETPVNGTVFLDARRVLIERTASVEAAGSIMVVSEESSTIGGPVSIANFKGSYGDIDIISRTGEVTILEAKGDAIDTRGALCVSAPQIRVFPGASVRAYMSAWVGREIAFAGRLQGKNPQSLHVFNVPSEDAVDDATALIEPARIFAIDPVPQLAKECQFQPYAYYALGDSVAAGHGLDRDDGRKLNTCQQSSLAYPYRVRDEIAKALKRGVFLRNFVHLACSGAASVTVDAEKGFDPTDLSEQVEQLLSEPVRLGEVALVSITIGANDFSFPDETRRGTNVCRGDYREGWLVPVAEHIEHQVSASLKQILDNRDAYVVVTGYYNPYNQASTFFEWLVHNASNFLLGANLQCLHLTVDDIYQRVDDIVRSVNESLRRAVEKVIEEGELYRGRVTFVPMYEAFTEHESPAPHCGRIRPGKATYIQHPTPGLPTVVSELAEFLRNDARNFGKGNDCFHPNANGARAYAWGVCADAREFVRYPPGEEGPTDLCDVLRPQ